jgi:choline kinase
MSAPTRPAATSAAPVDVAVVVATAPAGDVPAALARLDDGAVLARLVGQLTRLGVRRAIVFTRPEWERDVQAALGSAAEIRTPGSPVDELRAIAELARTTAGPMLFTYADIVTHESALEGLITDPKANTGILAGGRRRHVAFRVQARRGRVIAAATPYHTVRRHNATFLGVLRVAPTELPMLADAADRLAKLVADVPAAWQDELTRKGTRWRLLMGRGGPFDGDAEGDDFAAPDDSEDPEDTGGSAGALSPEHEELLANRLAAAPLDTVALLLLGLVRANAPIQPVYLRRLFWSRPLSPAAAARTQSRIAALDEDRLLLDSAVKSSDGFFTTFFVSPYSRYLARWAARRGLTPNQITLASLVIGILAAAAFAVGERWGLVVGAVLLQVAFTTDCVDGQLARYTRQFSKFGAWLDSILDRAKEYLVFAGLAIGADRVGDPVWLLACSALVLQVVRHTSDFSHAFVQRSGTGMVRQPPLEQPLDHLGAASGERRGAPDPRRRSLAARILKLWSRLDDVRIVRWLKRMAAFPIGERFAVISITAALFTPRVTFITLLAWGGFAVAYTQSGRILRALR